MSHIVVLGAGLGGLIMAYEMKAKLRREDRLTVINLGSSYSFVPSNPWVAVGWRQPADITVDFAPVLKQQGIELRPEGAKRVHPQENRVELNDSSSVDYDYLIIATGPDLAFDEIPGLGPDAHTQSVCDTNHALQAKVAFEALVKKPGPVVIGAVQGASCYGPAYEFAFILDTALRNARVRDRVPMTFVTPEPYIGHLGLDGVGDTKGLIESAMRNRHIKWITNARTTKVEPDKMIVEEVNDDGSLKTVHELPQAFSMLLPAFRCVPAVHGIEGPSNSHHDRQASAQPGLPKRLLGRRVCGVPAGRQDAARGGRAQDRLHDRIDGDGDGAEYRRAAPGRGAESRRKLERGLSRRFRRRRHRLRRPAADSAAQRQLVVAGAVGACRQDRLRKIFLAQDQAGKARDVL